ncbi:ERF family protein [Bosea sp. Root381]|uniref:ERF family protein n=1 Tax=Bosea sp. Root381 TaxID=1736524 RepID=UPI000B0B2A47|nr:ERF family protein [Bosea sp. Root381]
MTRLARSNRLIEAPSPIPPPALSLLSAALARGADGEMLERLIGFHERSQALEARKAFEKALAAAKAKIPVIVKNRQAMVGRQPYRHEDLAEIVRTITPILARNGLSYRFRSQTTGALVTVVCVISHRDGHSEENSLSASPDESGEKNSIQAIGSALTYLQRMTLKAALGLAASDDDDGQAAGSSALISRQQARELLDLIEEIGADKNALLQFFQIKGVTDLPAARFRQALTMLNSRRSN